MTSGKPSPFTSPMATRMPPWKVRSREKGRLGAVQARELAGHDEFLGGTTRTLKERDHIIHEGERGEVRDGCFGDGHRQLPGCEVVFVKADPSKRDIVHRIRAGVEEANVRNGVLVEE